jgi:hypothetical protein
MNHRAKEQQAFLQYQHTDTAYQMGTQRSQSESDDRVLKKKERQTADFFLKINRETFTAGITLV